MPLPFATLLLSIATYQLPLPLPQKKHYWKRLPSKKKTMQQFNFFKKPKKILFRFFLNFYRCIFCRFQFSF
jgi:hypothetical protein